ncbi:MAG: hypothetical protein Q9165_007169 [Trypethelium subeluteriae]
MQSTPLPPDPHLLAILLVVQSRRGPHFVFHYPPRPSPYQDSKKRQSSSYTAYGTNTSPSDDSDSRSSDETAWNSDADGDNYYGIGSRNGGTKRHDAGIRAGSTTGKRSKVTRGSTVDEEEEQLSDSSDADGIHTKPGKEGAEARRGGMVDWETVLGYSTDGLQKLLCPPRAFHKKRVEISLDGLAFLGCPMFVREDGLWRKDKRRKRRSEQSEGVDSHDGQAVNDSEAKPGGKAPIAESDVDELRRLESSQELPGDRSVVERSDSATRSTAGAVKALDLNKAASKRKSGKESKLTMFHVVFVMNPPAMEYQVRLDDMYRNVVKEFAKILKLEQAQSFYVWTQSKEILRLKQKAKDEHSIANVYNAISTSRIAHLKLSSPLEIPLQIPQPSSTSQVSTPMSPQLPGLWLTTASVTEADSHGLISPHMGIILMQDAEAILRDLAKEEQELSAALIYFVRNLISTKSLLKLSKILKLSLQELQVLSEHLISGRRARAIPPLHPRDTYIVSPNADMRQLSAATEAFAQRFPTFPSLPKMLNMLSGTPKSYGMLMPSKDHRPAYMEILAWLMRGGWVTQLRTFAWIRLNPEIQHKGYLKIIRTQAERAAAAAREAEEDKQGAEGQQRRRKDTEHRGSRTRTRVASNSSPMPTGSNSNNDPSPRQMPLPITPPNQDSPTQTPSSPTLPAASGPDLLSPILSALRPPSRPASATGSISSVRTAVHNPTRTDPPSAIPAPSSPLLSVQSPSLAPSVSAPSVSVSVYPSTEPQHYLDRWPVPALSELAPLVAYDARDATTKQFFDAALTLLGEELAKGDEEMEKLWPRLVRYFNGRWALEEISVREGLKRAKVQGLVGRLREERLLCIVRHW